MPIAGYRKEANNIVYLLKGCRKSDTSVKCEFVIKNKIAEKAITISGSDSSIVDSTGKSYVGSSIDIGGKNEYARSLFIAPEKVATSMPSENGKLIGFAAKYGLMKKNIRNMPMITPSVAYIIA